LARRAGNSERGKNKRREIRRNPGTEGKPLAPPRFGNAARVAKTRTPVVYSSHAAFGRGQLFSIDMLVAVTVAFLLFLAATVLSERLGNTLYSSEQAIELAGAAEAAAAQLVSSPGKPLDWNGIEFSEAAVNSVGLAESRNVFDAEKIERFFELAANQTALASLKKMLGLARPGYNFSITLYNQTGAIVNQTGPAQPLQKPAASADRVGVLNGSLARIRLVVWIE